MATVHFDRVQPGDLISSEFVNRLLDEVESLGTRVEALESAGGSPTAPVITDRFPQGDIRVRSELRLIGRNFLVPSHLNTVTIDGLSLTSFLAGSSDTQLIFDIPPTFTGLPKNVTVTVTNRNGSARTTIRLLPEVEVPLGKLVITDQTPDLGEAVQVGHSYLFQFLLDSQTTIPETYTVQPVFTNANGAQASAWRSGTALIGGTQVRITPQDPVTIGARVTVPAGAVSVDFAMAAEAQNSTDPSLNVTSSVRSLVIGQSQAVSDPRVKLQLAQIGPFDPQGNPAQMRNALIDGQQGVEVRFGQSGQLPVDVFDIQVQGTYRYEATIENAGTMWTFANPNPPETQEGAGGSQQVTVAVTCNATAPERRFMVVRAQRLKADGSVDFTSFVRFPIQGF
jgi:hypothetical protein